MSSQEYYNLYVEYQTAQSLIDNYMNSLSACQHKIKNHIDLIKSKQKQMNEIYTFGSGVSNENFKAAINKATAAYNSIPTAGTYCMNKSQEFKDKKNMYYNAYLDAKAREEAEYQAWLAAQNAKSTEK